MTDDIIKQVPRILEDPMIVMESKDTSYKDHRLTMFGEVLDSHNKPVLAILELEPSISQGLTLRRFMLASAYARSGNLQNFIDSSNVVYMTPDNAKIEKWATRVRLQLPPAVAPLSRGFVDSINERARKRNTQIRYSLPDTADIQTEVAQFLAGRYPGMRQPVASIRR